MPGLSIANNLLSNTARLNLDRNQQKLGVSVQRLSSGLRINTAADDPSGLAIAESLQAQVNGFTQATQNVQDATNAAQVAEGALQTTTDILQRIRTLAVQGASDVISSTDRSNLQQEVSQLLLEVNRISQNTNFNGQALLDGTHAGFQQEQFATAQTTSNADLAAGGTLIQNSTYAGAALSFNNTNSSIADGTVQVQVAQLTSTLQGLIVSFYTSGGSYNFSSTTGANVSVATSGGSIVAVLTYENGFFETSPGVTVAAGLASFSVDGVTLSFGSVGTLDVGVTSYVKIAQYVGAQSNPTSPAFNFQSGADEGATIQVGFLNTSTNSLRVANVNLIGNAGYGSLASEDAIGQIDHALQAVLAQRAQLGATIVRLQEDQNNNNITSVNLQASESAIRDLNIGQETTQYTRLQVLTQVGTSILAQSNQSTQQVLSLFR